MLVGGYIRCIIEVKIENKAVKHPLKRKETGVPCIIQCVPDVALDIPPTQQNSQYTIIIDKVEVVERFDMKPTLHLLFLGVVVGIQTSQGALWHVSVFIGTREYSASSDTLLLDVQGTANSLPNINLGNNFRPGEIRRIDLDGDFGKINIIRLYQTRNDGMRVQKVVLEDDNGRPYTFECNCWIQNDQPADDSKPSWTLNSLNCYWNDSIPNCAEVRRVSCQNGKCDTCNEGYILRGEVCRLCFNEMVIRNASVLTHTS
ncbi:uncharacterized protein LOC110458531 [Mizuhopecten yessoensis]|uniref:uncharacterized protein LOC110458531 n=1 Tax=Mizuhopecten yessoensis TaxID=6573 RepID=UPI000B458A2F|nr:uncharacterized protein LOC110458531 [Mizuhopecten yessoensis]